MRTSLYTRSHSIIHYLKLMKIHRKNSFAPLRSLEFSVVPVQPRAKGISLAASEGEMITFSYSAGPPSNPSDVMTPLTRTFELPQEGAPHSITAAGIVDDAVSLSVDGISKTSESGAPHPFELTLDGLSGGLHSLSLVHTNINYDPPSGNISVLSGSVGPCSAVDIIPDENEEEEDECECDEDEDGGEGPSDSSGRSSRFAMASDANSSSAGSGMSRSASVRSMRWAASFGVFRGLGGIPGGKLELMAYQYDASLLTPAGLVYRHPVASSVLVPEGGIAPNQMFRVYEGRAYTNYVCDANGREAFGVGSTSSKTNRAQFVTSLDKEESVVTTLAQASFLRIAKTNGSATFYSLTTGEFAGYISSQNSVLTAQNAENYLSILRQEDGSIRQVWTLWDGLADIMPAETGYAIHLYLPGQITGVDGTTGLYTVTGTPFKTFSITGDAAAKTLTVTEHDLTLPESMPPYVTTWEQGAGGWNIIEGTGEEAISTTREKTALTTDGTYRVATSISKAGVAASVIAEEYLSHVTGELMLSRTEGYGSPEAQTTTYEYDDAGRVIRIVAADGGETTYIHDALGRVTVTTTPWAGGKSKLVQTTYLDDGSEYSGEPSQVDVSFLTSTGISQLSLKEIYTYSVAEQIKRVERRSTANGITRLEITETWQGNAENPYARGRVRMRQVINGVQTWYEYAPSEEYGALYTVIAETRINGTSVAGNSTRSIRYITTQGNTVREEEMVLDTQGTWQLLSFADDEFDMQNRRIKRTWSNGRTTTRSLMCTGNVLRETDEDGVLTTYSYDSARQLIETIRSATPTTPETITSYTRDALGRVLQTRRDVGAMTTIQASSYDLLGRMTSLTDELGRLTSCAYSVDGLTTTITTPTGATLITVRHTDGSIAHEYGTGQRELYHVYDYSGGRVRETVKLADQTTILSQTLQNGFGETVVVTSATTTGYLYDRTTYNDKGQMTQTVRDTGSGAVSMSMAPTLYEYDAFGNVTKETWKLASTPTTGNSKITTYSYNVESGEFGIYRVVTVTKNNGKGTTYQETRKELISMMSPVLESKTVSFDPRSNITTQWSEYGQGSERIRKVTIPTSSLTAVSTIIDGFETNRTDHAGVASSQSRTYTSEGLRLTQTDGRGNATVTLTDLAGRTIAVTDAAGNATTTQYDQLTGSPSLITDALGKTSCYAYDKRGRKIAEWGTGIQPATFTYDEADRVATLTTYRAGDEEITTNPSGRTDGDTTTWAYHDASGLVTSKTYADASHEDTAYNALNMLVQKTDARGIVSTYTWDTNKGVCTQIAYSDGTPTQHFTYNHIGNLYQVIDASGTRGITYNIYNEQETDGIAINEVLYTVTEAFDTFGRSAGYALNKDATALDTVVYGYGTEGRLATASFLHDGERTFTYSYLPGTHLLHGIAHPNGILVTRSYEERRDLITSMNATRGTTDVVLRDYTYQLGRPITRICSRKGATRNDAFTYNDRSELASANLGTTPYAYAYDNIGNRETAQEAAQAVTTYLSDPLNQYSGITPGEETPFLPEYDAAGNQTKVKTSTGIWIVVYDANNRPISFTSQDAKTVITCGYDYMGRRYTKKVTVGETVTLHQFYLYRGYLQIAALDLTRSHLPALWFLHWDPTQPVATRPISLRKNATWYTYGHDLTKNVTELYNIDGTIATVYDYAPYGAVTASGTEQPFQWSSEVYDAELALVYYNYRHYSPMDGRWISRDPLANNPNMNLYSYVVNPLSNIDILGQMALSDCEQIIGITTSSPGRLSKRIRLILEDLEENSCMPSFSCFCENARAGEDGRQRINAGGFHPNSNEITLNCKAYSSTADMIETIQHELVHAWQHCHIPRQNTCEGSICRELAAYREAGRCQRLAREIPGFSVKDCIIDGAYGSALGHCQNEFPEGAGLKAKIRQMYERCKKDYLMDI